MPIQPGPSAAGTQCSGCTRSGGKSVLEATKGAELLAPDLEVERTGRLSRELNSVLWGCWGAAKGPPGRKWACGLHPHLRQGLGKQGLLNSQPPSPPRSSFGAGPAPVWRRSPFRVWGPRGRTGIPRGAHSVQEGAIEASWGGGAGGKWGRFKGAGCKEEPSPTASGRTVQGEHAKCRIRYHLF